MTGFNQVVIKLQLILDIAFCDYEEEYALVGHHAEQATASGDGKALCGRCVHVRPCGCFPVTRGTFDTLSKEEKAKAKSWFDN